MNVERNTLPDDDEPIPLAPEAPIELPPSRPRSREPAPTPSAPSRKCPGCGYEMRGLPVGARCPECGAFAGAAPRQRGPSLLLHAGRSTVNDVLWKLAPIAIVAVAALCVLCIGTAGVLVDDRAVYAMSLLALPLIAIGLFLASSRLTRPEEMGDPATRRVQLITVAASLFWIAHAVILAKLHLAMSKVTLVTPLSSQQDLEYVLGLACAIFGAIVYFLACAARFRSLERWITSDNEGSLFSGGTGFFLFGPLLIFGLVHAGFVMMNSPLSRVFWRVDRAIIFLGTIDIAWRSLRALRLTMHSRRHAVETFEREVRIESDREERVSELLRRMKG